MARQKAITARFFLMLLMTGFAGCKTPQVEPISSELPAGFRAVAIEVPASEARMVEPRDRVDILVTREVDGTRKSYAFLQSIVVLRVEKSKGERAAVYVALNPNEAQYAVLENISDHFHITVRPRGDIEIRPVETGDLQKLLRDPR